MSERQILLVEDNELNRDMLRRRLQRAGYETLLAADGQEALDVVKSDHPALVLLDMNLPVLDGWTVCRRIREDDSVSETPVIALTAHAMAEDREKAMAAGCDDYATKPIDFPDLLEKIGRLLAA